jgi:hypothetical protein
MGDQGCGARKWLCKNVTPGMWSGRMCDNHVARLNAT